MSSEHTNGFYVPVIAVAGVGLIGGSLALALKQRGMVNQVIGFGRSRENLEKAKILGAIDEISTSIAEAARKADIIVLATPAGSMADILEEILPELDQNKIITDVASVKHGIVEQALDILGPLSSRFVPAHPIAGKEHSGVTAASDDLFQDHKVAITPSVKTDADACRRIEDMWSAVGADVVTMGVAEHDRVLAMTSHLPHILAYAMVHLFASGKDKEKCYEMAAGGFYDFTRIASSDPVMWRDICRMNREQVLTHIENYQETLERIASMIEKGDDDEIEALFASAKAARAIVTERRKGNKDQSEAERQSGKRRVQQLVNR
jgi:prephenate dehydrogenase